jgi:cell division protein ZapE
MTMPVLAEYARRIAAGMIERDPAQQAIVGSLAKLQDDLAAEYAPGKSLARLLGLRSAEAIRGIYIFGDVGRGKTMLMDMFFDTTRVKRKRRVHFHEFMGEVHERIHALRHRIKSGEITAKDPIALAAVAIARETRLLCFDEFHVTDIADAMILGRLFKHMFAAGVVAVATSNVPPAELYRNGLNRALFLPFIALIETHMHIVRLSARTDFRMEQLAGAPVWHVPADATAKAALDATWRRLTAGHAGEPQSLAILGRTIRVPQAAMGVARFSFGELCQQPLAAADYLKIAHAFHTVLLDGVPVMNYERRNEAKRFIILIDTLYDNAVKLVASAEAQPDALYRANAGFEAYEFSRTASRLIEMRSDRYLSLPHGRSHAVEAASTKGLVET